MYFFLIFIGAISLSLTFILTTFSFIIRMVGAINNINAKSWNLASAITLFNSFFIAIALSTIAYFVDSRPDLKLIIIIFLLSSFIVLLGHLYMFYNFNQISKIIKNITNFYFSKDIAINEINEKFNNFDFDFFTFLAWVFFMIGFIFPTTLAIIFNDYRTTLFQLSFVFNSLGTFITIVITEKKASLLSDKNVLSKKDYVKIIDYLSIIIFNRIYANVLIILILIIGYLAV